MPTFRYSAADADGNPVSGELEAATSDEALQALAARGLQAEPSGIWEIAQPTSGRRELSAEEAVDLTAQMADLAKAGLPLAPGLRAMADECSHRRVSHVLREVASELESGGSLESAFEALGARFPRHVRGVVLAGLRSGRLPEALEEFVEVERDQVDLRHRVWLAMAYPGLLLLILAVLFFFLAGFVIPQFAAVYEDFGVELPPLTQLIVWCSLPGLRGLAGLPALLLYLLLFLATTRIPVWGRRVLYAIPLFGPLWRFQALAAFSRLMGLMLSQQIPLPDALRFTADGLREADLAVACRRAARQIRDGQSLSESLFGYWQFPPTLKPFIHWGEQSAALAEGFRAAGEMFERRLRAAAGVFEVVMPAIVFLIVIASIGLLIVGLFLPLISLIQSLT